MKVACEVLSTMIQLNVSYDFANDAVIDIF